MRGSAVRIRLGPQSESFINTCARFQCGAKISLLYLSTMEPGYTIPRDVESLQEQRQSPRKTHWKALVFVLVGLVGVLLLLGFIFAEQFSIGFLQKSRAGSLSVPEGLEGQIFLTLSQKNGDGLAPYVFDFNTNSLELLGDEAMPGKGVVHTLYHSISSDGTWGSFVGVVDEEYEAAGQNMAVAQVYRAELSDAPGTEAAFDQAQAVTYVISAQKRLPSISRTGEVVYVSRGAGVADKNINPLNDAESWVVYYVDNIGVERLVDFGISPKWVDDTHFVFWKNDGMYVHSVIDSSSKKIWGSHGAIFSNMKMDVSDDGRFVAWSAPDNGRVFVLEVLDWSLPSLKLKNILDVHGFWVAFSPDGTSLAVQAVDWESLSTNPRPRLEFYDLESLEKIPFEIDLDAFKQEFMFMTDWAK